MSEPCQTPSPVRGCASTHVHEVALFGGSFNPPHVAHLLAGCYLLATRDLDLWIMPCANHPFGKELQPFEERLAMCRLLAAELGPRASATEIEAELGGEGRTIDTVLALQALHRDLSFRLVVGADVLLERHLWKRWDDLSRLAPPIVLGRDGVDPPEGFELEITLPQVSSTEIRRRISAGEPVDRLVPRSVLAHIRARGLYLDG
jgi:nicotinate-nucleotide adenylyltransferase